MNQPKTPDWLAVKIAEGIQLLMALRLKRAPFAGSPEDVFAVCEAWLVVLSNRSVHWEESLDGDRIEVAFKQLGASVTEWPSPAEFLACLPDRRQAQLPKKGKKLDERAKRQGRKTLKKLLMQFKSSIPH